MSDNTPHPEGQYTRHCGIVSLLTLEETDLQADETRDATNWVSEHRLCISQGAPPRFSFYSELSEVLARKHTFDVFDLLAPENVKAVNDFMKGLPAPSDTSSNLVQSVFPKQGLFLFKTYRDPLQLSSTYSWRKKDGTAVIQVTGRDSGSNVGRWYRNRWGEEIAAGNILLFERSSDQSDAHETWNLREFRDARLMINSPGKESQLRVTSGDQTYEEDIKLWERAPYHEFDAVTQTQEVRGLQLKHVITRDYKDNDLSYLYVASFWSPSEKTVSQESERAKKAGQSGTGMSMIEQLIAHSKAKQK